MINLWSKLKSRWGIDSNFQAGLILLSFALSGPTTLWFHRRIDMFFGITDDSSFWLKFAVFMVIVYPVFNFFLFVYGSILGQYKFVSNFILTKISLLKKVLRVFNTK